MFFSLFLLLVLFRVGLGWISFLTRFVLELYECLLAHKTQGNTQLRTREYEVNFWGQPPLCGPSNSSLRDAYRNGFVIF